MSSEQMKKEGHFRTTSTLSSCQPLFKQAVTKNIAGESEGAKISKKTRDPLSRDKGKVKEEDKEEGSLLPEDLLKEEDLPKDLFESEEEDNYGEDLDKDMHVTTE